MPVSRYCTELITPVVPVVTTAVANACVWLTVGTWSPTWILAVWLSDTMIWGEAMMFSFELAAMAFSTVLMEPAVSSQA